MFACLFICSTGAEAKTLCMPGKRSNTKVQSLLREFLLSTVVFISLLFCKVFYLMTYSEQEVFCLHHSSYLPGSKAAGLCKEVNV